MKDDIDRAVEAAIWHPDNERSDGLRAGAVATCRAPCDQRLTLVGVGRTDSLVLDWQWRHVVNGNPASDGDHAADPINPRNFGEEGP